MKKWLYYFLLLAIPIGANASDTQESIKHKKAAEARRAQFKEQLSRLPASAQPEQPYISKDACPGECCSFGKWQVTKDLTLVDTPYSDKEVLEIKAGETITSITGQVHLEPAPYAVVHNAGPFKQGTIFWLLDYLGEGYANYWYQGQQGEEEFIFLYDTQYCAPPSPSCWAEPIVPELHDPEVRKHQWWIKIKAQDGQEGWTDKKGHFDANQVYTCG